MTVDFPMPQVGLRCEYADASADDNVYKTALEALKKGSRLLDTTYLYNNERAAAQAIKDSGLARHEVYVTAKLWSTFHRDPAQGLAKTLANLDTDYVDLYLVHWPVALIPDTKGSLIPRKSDGSRNVDSEWTLAQTWVKMQELLATGKVKQIGVANLSSSQLTELVEAPTTTVRPAVAQVELHPFLQQAALIEVAKANGIAVQGYCPTSGEMMNLLSHPQMTKLTKKYGASRGEVLAAWMRQSRGASCVLRLPRSNDPIPQLESEDVTAIDSLAMRGRSFRVLKPDWGVTEVFSDDTA